jgi:hypothetical protein
VVLTVAVAACGDDDEGSDAADGAPSDESVGDTSSSGDLDVCALLDDGEIESLLGASLPSEPGSGDPYPSCSWQTGRLIVQVDRGTDSIVLAPGQECPSVDIGDEAVSCPGSVQFVTNGTRVIVQTIEDDDVTEDQLTAVAAALEPKFED